MKKFYKLILILTFFLMTQNLFAIEKSYFVKGMTCGSCAKSITEEIKKHTQVESVDINLETTELKITYKENEKNLLSESDLKKDLENAGGYELLTSPPEKKDAPKVKKEIKKNS